MLLIFLVAWARKSALSQRSATRRAFAAGRLLAFLAFVSVVVSFACARRASAEMASKALGVGHDLLPLVQELGGAATVTLNGERITLKYDGTTRTPRQVLDAAEEACRRGGVDPTRGLGIVRRGTDDEGVVVCFAPGRKTRPTVAEQLEAFVGASDLGAIGKLRYVYAKRNGERDGEGSAALVATTEDSFALSSLSAADDGADSPGADDPSLPRPLASQRFLSAQIEGAPYGARGYRTKLTADAVRARWDADMLARGFTSIDVPTGAGRAHGYSKDGVLVTFATTADTNGDTLVSVGTMGADRR